MNATDRKYDAHRIFAIRTQNDGEVQEYLRQMTDKADSIALQIAIETFGKNFHIKETRGFIEWRQKR